MGFNARLQPERLRVGTANDPAQACGLATDALCLELSYGSLTANTGNILSQRIWAAKPGGGHLNVEQSYGYDGVNRSTTFTETVLGGGAGGGGWTETNQYDRWGNRCGVLAEHNGSGQTVRVFCQQAKVNEHAFYNWTQAAAQWKGVRFPLVEAGSPLHRPARMRR